MNFLLSNNKKCEQFVSTFMNIKTFAESVNIAIYEDRLYAQGMDPSHVALFEIVLLKEWFDRFETSDGTQHIGISLTILQKILKTWKPDHSIELSCKKDSAKLHIRFHGKHKKSFKMSLLDIDMELLQIPEINHPLQSCIASSMWKEILDELIMFGDSVSMTCNNDQMKLKAKDDELLCLMKNKISKKHFQHYAFNIEEYDEIHITYSLRYLIKACAFHKVASQMNIHMDPNVPLQITYYFENTNMDESDECHDKNEDNYVRFYIAPKEVDDDEESDDDSDDEDNNDDNEDSDDEDSDKDEDNNCIDDSDDDISNAMKDLEM